jgi:integrase
LGTISGMNLKIKYVIKDVDRYGVVRWYYRKPGCAKIKLPSPDHPSFFEALAVATQHSVAKEPSSENEGTLRWLCSAYYDSAAYKTLAPQTRHVRKLILDKVCQKHGALPFKAVGSDKIMAWRDAQFDRPEAANSLVKALRQVFGWAKDAKHVSHNDAADVSYLASDNPDGFYTWTPSDIEAFSRTHPVGSKAHLALSLLLYSGVRRSDVVRLGPQLVKEGAFHFVEWKGRGRKRTRKERAVPIIPALQEAIDTAPKGNLVYLTTTFGKPFTSNGFGNWFKDRCVEAGLPHCSAHGLRKAAAVTAAEAGCSTHELMALFGWTSVKQAELYTRKANRDKLSQSGASKVVQLLSRKKSNS